MTPRVTIAIPTYNGGRFLRQTIESLLAQTEREISIVCIDDASTDDTVAVARAAAARRACGRSAPVSSRHRGACQA